MVDFLRQPLDLGDITVSPAVAAALGLAAITGLLVRHAAGDWGDVTAEVTGDNFRALVTGRGLVTSVHRFAAGAVLVATELDRRETSVLFAEEI